MLFVSSVVLGYTSDCLSHPINVLLNKLFFFLPVGVSHPHIHTCTHEEADKAEQRAGEVDKSRCLHAPVDTLIVSCLFPLADAD